MEKRRNCSSFPQYFLHVVRFSCLGRDQIFTSRKVVIRDKRVRHSESQLYKKFRADVQKVVRDVHWKPVSNIFSLSDNEQDSNNHSYTEKLKGFVHL